MSDTTKVDAMVLELLKRVEEKKQQIGNAERPSWITNCSFGFNPETNTRINIQVVRDMAELVSIHAFLSNKYENFKASLEDLGLTEKEVPFKWLNFSYEEWVADIETRLSQIQIKTKKEELTKLETRVNALVSPDQRRAIELEKLVQELK